MDQPLLLNIAVGDDGDVQIGIMGGEPIAEGSELSCFDLEPLGILHDVIELGEQVLHHVVLVVELLHLRAILPQQLHLHHPL